MTTASRFSVGWSIMAAVVLAVAGSAVTRGGSGAAASVVQGTVLARFDLERRLWHDDLPRRLREVSGLAVDSAGRLFAHGDEQARVFELDPASGEVLRSFRVGSPVLEGDFEGIATAGDRFFLVSSVGRLVEFRDGEDGASVPYRMTDLGVGESCEVEGLDFDAARRELVAACKTTDRGKDVFVLHRFPLDPDAEAPPPVAVAASGLERFGLEPRLHPSAVVVDPATGHLILAAARESCLVELDPEGGIVDARRLRRRRHPQPEGLALGTGGTLLVADEENGRDARLTAYGPLPPTP